MDKHDVVEMPESLSRVQQQVRDTTPADLVRIALESGADIDRLEKLMEMQIRWEANQARKTYVEAMAEFKKNPPEIFKRKQVSFGDTSYMHATLGDVTASIIEALAQHGFSHRWDTDQQEGGQIVVTCILTHAAGHSEKTTLKADRDQSGKKNNIQALASTVTYLQRYTLLAAVGIATKDMDDDGRKSELDTTLADKWIDAANMATNISALKQVWAHGVKEIQNAKDMYAYKEFKACVEKKGAAFKTQKPVQPAGDDGFVAEMDAAGGEYAPE